jgi:hypothetical protein
MVFGVFKLLCSPCLTQNSGATTGFLAASYLEVVLFLHRGLFSSKRSSDFDMMVFGFAVVDQTRFLVSLEVSGLEGYSCRVDCWRNEGLFSLLEEFKC